MYFDIHTHRAYSQNNVVSIYNIRASHELDSNYTGAISYGIHPWDTLKPNIIESLNALTNYKDLKAIGECGLDKCRSGTKKQQIKLFVLQVEWSEKLLKPVIIHCVGRYNEIISLRKSLGVQQPWIMHGFFGHPQLAHQLLDAGFYLSFGSDILNENSKAAMSLQSIGNYPFFLETDESSRTIENIYQQAADIIGIGIDQLKHKINKYYNQIF